MTKETETPRAPHFACFVDFFLHLPLLISNALSSRAQSLEHDSEDQARRNFKQPGRRLGSSLGLVFGCAAPLRIISFTA